MKKKLTLIIVSLFLVSGTGFALAGEKAPQKVVGLAHTRLAVLGTDPVIVEAVKAENAKGKTLDQP